MVLRMGTLGKTGYIRVANIRVGVRRVVVRVSASSITVWGN